MQTETANQNDFTGLLRRARVGIETTHEELQNLRDSNGWLKIQMAALAQRALQAAKKFGMQHRQVLEKLKALQKDMHEILDASELQALDRNILDVRSLYNIYDGAVLELARSDQATRQRLQMGWNPKLQS